MMFIEDTPIPDDALPLTRFRAHLRLGSGFSSDNLQSDLLNGFLRSAIAAVEARIGKALISRSFSIQYADWRNPAQQVLPIAPVASVDGLDLVDEHGIAVPAPPTMYRLGQDTHTPAIYGVPMLPAIPLHGHAVVSVTAGLAVQGDDIPADLLQAVLLLATHFYDHRDDTSLGEGCMPFGVVSLIQRYRTLRLGAAQ